MPYREIQQAVAQIHEELKKAPLLSPESALLLQKAMQEIESSLKEKGPQALFEKQRLSPLESWLIDFGDEHPKISSWARAILNQANALGI